MDVSTYRGIPILGIDVWEHAYYPQIPEQRGDYLSAIWNVINWNQVNENYLNALNDDLLRVIEKDAWTELKEFHKVMAATFHPAEEGDFKPIESDQEKWHSKPWPSRRVEYPPLSIRLKSTKQWPTL